jgi:hypothetical protein
VAWSSGQELDTALLREKAAERSTIIDQVADARERRAFLKLYGARQKRYTLAETFLATYPQSCLLLQVYEIAAKASIDLRDYAAALRHGAQSLHLLPENPLLLVPLANVQVQQGQLAEAQRSAQAGLGYLDEFDRPAAISTAKWPATQAELKASAYYVLGRVAIANALRATGGERRRELEHAEDFLVHARRSILRKPDGQPVRCKPRLRRIYGVSTKRRQIGRGSHIQHSSRPARGVASRKQPWRVQPRHPRYPEEGTQDLKPAGRATQPFTDRGKRRAWAGCCVHTVRKM